MAIINNGKSAISHVLKLQRLEQNRTLLAVRLETGRTHQIRVHLASIHHAVIGDPLYAMPHLSEEPLQLHAAMLTFCDPVSGEEVTVFAPPPEDFESEDIHESSVAEV